VVELTKVKNVRLQRVGGYFITKKIDKVFCNFNQDVFLQRQ